MMRRCLAILSTVLTIAALALMASACGSACADLGRKVCNCQPTREKQSSCQLALRTAKDNYNLSDSQENQCEKILKAKTCTCEALAAGDLAACGLAEDAEVAFD